MPKRVDANQNEIVDTFRQLGISVLILSEVGKGCPDLCLGYAGRNYFIEIKNGHKCKSHQKLTNAEKSFQINWKGHHKIINSVDSAISFAKEIRNNT